MYLVQYNKNNYNNNNNNYNECNNKPNETLFNIPSKFI